MSRPTRSKARRRLRLLLAIGTLTGLAAAYRFALRYRERVGLPHRSPAESSPADFGLAFEDVRISAEDHELAGWFVRATADEPTEDSSTPESPAPKRRRAGKVAATTGPRPGIVVVHGWESNRGRTFAHVRYLHAAGFHCLVFDVRGHGDSPSETLPINIPEFADDTIAAVRWLAARPEVSAVGVLATRWRRGSNRRGLSRTGHQGRRQHVRPCRSGAHHAQDL